MKSWLCFDIEISKTPKQIMAELGLKEEKEIFNYPHLLGFAVGVVYNSLTKEFLTFNSAQEMAKYLLTNGDFLVSFNGRRFDIPCLLNGVDIDTFNQLQLKPHLDLLKDFYDNVQGRFRVSLNNIAEQTLKRVKTGNGANAPVLFQEGKWDELVDYCKNDVEITKEIFEFGCQFGYIYYYDHMNQRKEEMSALYLDWTEGEEEL